MPINNKPLQPTLVRREEFPGGLKLPSQGEYAVAKSCIFTFMMLTLCVASSATAAIPSDTLLPPIAKGYLSVPDVDLLRAKWQETQLGQLVNDPIMAPFIEDLKEQIKSKLSKTRIRLGITIDDLEDVYGGEVSISALQPGNDETQHALALIVDITDHQTQAQDLLARVTKNLTDQGAKYSTATIEGLEAHVFQLPKERADEPQVEAFYFIEKDTLIATDHREVAGEIAARLAGKSQPSLKDVAAYRVSMQRCQQESGEMKPHIRWFLEPFGYTEVARASSGGRKKRGMDLVKVLKNQGFAAIQGVGGYAFLSTGEHEILHRAFVYAPAVKQQAGENANKYELAARMLQFPNTKTLFPQDWVTRELGSYVSFNMKLTEAFEYSKSLVNEIIGAKPGEDLFEDIIGSIATDKDGPQVDLRKDLVDHFAERVSMVSDCRLPITPESERLMFAVELTDPEAVRKTVNKALEADPDAKKLEFDGQTIWEILTDQAPAEFEELQIEGDGFDPFGEAPAEEEEEEEEERRVLPNSAITVAHGHLIVASHVDFIVDLLKRPVGVDRLVDTADYQIVGDALDKIGSNEDSARVFTRTDEAYRPTYELIRQGKMPESKTLLGKLLNRLLGPEEEGILREQQIDGSKMPEFDAVRRYLGPAGLFVRSDEDGWFTAGCMLTKDLD
jgi:hypothetical protein